MASDLAKLAELILQITSQGNPLELKHLERTARRPEGPFGHPEVLECRRIDQVFPVMKILEEPGSGHVLDLTVDPDGQPAIGAWLPDPGRCRPRERRKEHGVWYDSVVCGPKGLLIRRSNTCQELGANQHRYRYGLRPRIVGFLHGMPVTAFEPAVQTEGSPVVDRESLFPLLSELCWGDKRIASDVVGSSIIDADTVAFLLRRKAGPYKIQQGSVHQSDGFIPRSRDIYTDVLYERFLPDYSGRLSGLVRESFTSARPFLYRVELIDDRDVIYSGMQLLDVVSRNGRSIPVPLPQSSADRAYTAYTHYLRGWTEMQLDSVGFVGSRPQHGLAEKRQQGFVCMWMHNLPGPGFDLVSDLFCISDNVWCYWGYTKDPDGIPSRGHLWLMSTPPFHHRHPAEE